MVKRRTIRALVIIDPIGFFYDGGLPGGAMYEALQAFQSFINGKIKTGATTKVEGTFLPVSIGQIEAALEEVETALEAKRDASDLGSRSESSQTGAAKPADKGGEQSDEGRVSKFQVSGFRCKVRSGEGRVMREFPIKFGHPTLAPCCARRP
jgi:hypothetical protein